MPRATTKTIYEAHLSMLKKSRITNGSFSSKQGETKQGQSKIPSVEMGRKSQAQKRTFHADRATYYQSRLLQINLLIKSLPLPTKFCITQYPVAFHSS